jgi:hypothetical protein
LLQDYFEVHHTPLANLVSRAEQLVLSDPGHVTVERFGNASEGIITAGALAIEDVPPAFESHEDGVDQTNVEDVVELRNQNQVLEAEARFAGLRARTTMAWIIEQTKQGLLNSESTPSTLTYAWAERHTADPGEGVSIEITKLHDVEQVGEVAQYKLSADDGPVCNELTITMIGDQFTEAHASVEPKEDDELRHWAEVLGADMGNVQTALIGNFEDEVALDATLSNIQRHFAGTPEESDLGSILEALRARAIAARESIGLKQAFDVASPLPSAETLAGWVQELNAI